MISSATALTTIPAGRFAGFGAWNRPPEHPGHTASAAGRGFPRAFPLAGLVVGLAGGLAYIDRGQDRSVRSVGGILPWPSTASLTGALHEDGWADFADGLGARGDLCPKVGGDEGQPYRLLRRSLLYLRDRREDRRFGPALHAPDRVVTALVAASCSLPAPGAVARHALAAASDGAGLGT